MKPTVLDWEENRCSLTLLLEAENRTNAAEGKLIIFNEVVYSCSFTLDPVISFMGSYPEDISVKKMKQQMHMVINCGIIFNIRELETTQMPPKLQRKLVELKMVQLNNWVQHSHNREQGGVLCSSMKWMPRYIV